MAGSAYVRIGIAAAILLVVLYLVSRTPSGPEIAPGSTVVLDVRGSYVEGLSAPLVARLFGDDRRPFVELLGALALAERDDRVGTVVLHIRELEIGWGKAAEIRSAIGRLREAGRKTVAYLELASFSPNIEYYVASAADEVYIPPGSSLPMVGLAAEHLYLGGLWRKVGVEIEVAKVGKYKSAAESLAGQEMSSAAREMANSLLDSTFEEFLRGIADGRGMEIERARAAIDEGPATAEELQAAGFIDGVASLHELTERVGGPVVDHDEYAGVLPEEVGFEPAAEFALIYGAGNVVVGSGTSSRTGSPVLASETVSEALIEAAEDPRFDAIILRIDSPGGSALASEVVWSALQRARASGKPVVASLSDVAASGGYYVAAGADAIVAPPLVLTGSIGVFALRPIFGRLLDQVGIGVESLTRGEHADFYLSARPLSEGANARLQGLVEETYELFVERVARGRGMEVSAVEAVAQGRVWTGAQALEAGLVDELGGLHAAVDRAKGILGLAASDDVALVPYPLAETLADQVRAMLGARAAGALSLRLSPPESTLWAVIGALGPPSRALRGLEGWVSAMPINQPLMLAPLLVDIR